MTCMTGGGVGDMVVLKEETMVVVEVEVEVVTMDGRRGGGRSVVKGYSSGLSRVNLLSSSFIINSVHYLVYRLALAILKRKCAFALRSKAATHHGTSPSLSRTTPTSYPQTRHPSTPSRLHADTLSDNAQTAHVQ